MDRVNDPFWSRQTARECCLMRPHTLPMGGKWCALWLVRASPLLLNQIGPFMKQSQAGFMNDPD